MIPNIFHFVYFDSEEGKNKRVFSIADYLAIRSAIEVNKPEAVYFHFNYEPEGPWWEKIKPYIRLQHRTPPTEIFGNKLYHVAHQADVTRLQVLKEFGGIYLDLDTICVKPLHPLLQFPFVMGQELKAPRTPKNWRQKIKYGIRNYFSRSKEPEITGFCSAVIMSEKNSDFVNAWLDSYKTFRSRGKDKYWNEHSGIISAELAKSQPDMIKVMGPYSFHYPLYTPAGLKQLFEEVHAFPQAYVHHVWNSFSGEKYLKRLTPENIFTENTTYNIIARKFL